MLLRDPLIDLKTVKPPKITEAKARKITVLDEPLRGAINRPQVVGGLA